MKKRRFLAAVLAVVLSVSLFLPGTVRAGAVGTFPDVNSSAMAENVEILRLMGVISGMPDGTFQPGGVLTRSQFCKMAITLMGGTEQVGQYKSYTIFPDVRASHWAAGYINMAVRGETKLIAGYPNGKFGPEDTVTCGQAVTILMRLLGYKDEDVGAVWPDGYMSAAASAGLLSNLKLNASAAMTRGAAAQLFRNLLSTETKDGSRTYLESRASSVQQDIILLNSNATAEDGTSGAVLISDGTYKMAGGVQSSGVLDGKKGTLALDSDGNVLTFVPNQNVSGKTVTLSEAKAGYLMDSDGTKYTVNANTVVYHDDERTTYGEMFTELRSGTAVSIYFTAAGKVDYVFVGASQAAEAVVIAKNGSSANLSALAGGRTDYKILKNGVVVSASALQQYDVATYNASTNTIRVSDVKLTGVYEDTYPNSSAPVRVQVLGHEFKVLDCGISDFAGFKIGDSITLLMTEDGQAAGAVSADKVKGNAVGIVDSASTGGITVTLLNGLQLSGGTTLNADNAERLNGRLVTVASYKVGQITATPVSNKVSGSPLDMTTRTMGNYGLASNIRVFEQVNDGAVKECTLNDITVSQVDPSDIVACRADYSGKIDLLVLNNVTGCCYIYGRVKYTPYSGEENDYYGGTGSLTLTYGEEQDGTVSQKSQSFSTNAGFKDGSYYGIVPTASGDKIAAWEELHKLDNVSNAAWTGKESVTIQGTLYPVAEDVACYNSTTEKWVTLSAAKAFADTATLYYDKDPAKGGKIRIVVVKQ